MTNPSRVFIFSLFVGWMSCLAVGCAATTSTVATPEPAAAPKAAERPNIVMILLDDAGYSDLGVFGSEIETPSIGEINDLAAKYPERLEELARRWEAYAEANGVVEPNTPTLYARPPH